jgi:isoquinoline 1-oxidoreductase subunit beta
MSVTRRDFLKVAGLSGGALTLNIMLPFHSSASVAPVIFEPNLLVNISNDNTVSFVLLKQEMGQGVITGLSMIFADEMGADLQTMKIIHSDYKPNAEHVLQGITGGSSSIQRCWLPLRESAATAREILLQAAAETWGVKKGDCYAEKSKVIHRPTGKQIAFGNLVEKASKISAPEPVQLKNASDFQYIGKPIKSLNTKDIVTGKYNYGIDVSLPEMLYASIERCPVHLGTIKSFDDSKARKVNGVVDVVKISRLVRPVSVGVPGWNLIYDYTIEEGLAVIASSTWAAMQGRKALDIVWDEGENGSAHTGSFAEKIDRIKDSELVVTWLKGDVNGKQTENGSVVEGKYETPYMAHAVMEPHNTTASVKGNACELWSGTQFGKRIVEEVSGVLNMPVENVKCHVMPSGGGFGRNWEADFAVEAALVSQAVQKPVKTTWTREDVTRHDYFHPPQQDHHRVLLDNTNSIHTWTIDQFCCFKMPKDDPWNPYAYAVPNYRTRKIDLPSPVETGPWRSVTEHKDTFTLETFVDEIAAHIKADPLEFRLQQLKKYVDHSNEDPNRIPKIHTDRQLTTQVLEVAADKAGWGKKSNLGIAVAKFNSHCAQVAEVDIDKGNVIVKKITVAIHCGIAVNPLLIENQVQGAVIFALQALRYGGITLKNGRVEQSNFHDYKMLRIDEVPEISVHIIPSTDPPKGAGEPGVPALAPAVLNAVYALTGKRIRKIPLLKKI